MKLNQLYISSKGRLTTRLFLSGNTEGGMRFAFPPYWLWPLPPHPALSPQRGERKSQRILHVIGVWQAWLVILSVYIHSPCRTLPGFRGLSSAYLIPPAPHVADAEMMFNIDLSPPWFRPRGRHLPAGFPFPFPAILSSVCLSCFNSSPYLAQLACFRYSMALL
jgi:hypothetical protein